MDPPDLKYWLSEVEMAEEGMTRDIPNSVLSSTEFYDALDADHFERLTLTNARQLMRIHPNSYGYLGRHRVDYHVVMAFLNVPLDSTQLVYSHLRQAPKQLFKDREFLVKLVDKGYLPYVRAIIARFAALRFTREPIMKLAKLIDEMDRQRKKRLREILH